MSRPGGKANSGTKGARRGSTLLHASLARNNIPPRLSFLQDHGSTMDLNTGTQVNPFNGSVAQTVTADIAYHWGKQDPCSLDRKSGPRWGRVVLAVYLHITSGTTVVQHTTAPLA